MDGKIAGYVFLLPCSEGLMEKFVRKEIDESTLFEEIKKLKFGRVPEAIYLCASIVREKFRGKGLATLAFVKSINKITDDGGRKPILFYWEYSKEGGSLVRKVASVLKLELRVRTD